MDLVHLHRKWIFLPCFSYFLGDKLKNLRNKKNSISLAESWQILPPPRLDYSKTGPSLFVFMWGCLWWALWSPQRLETSQLYSDAQCNTQTVCPKDNSYNITLEQDFTVINLLRFMCIMCQCRFTSLGSSDHRIIES